MHMVRKGRPQEVAMESSDDQVQEVSALEGYALWASSYDSDSERNALIVVEEPHVDALLASLPMTAVLDVGTGTGRYALKLAQRGATVTAIDQSPEMLAVARYTAHTKGLVIDFQLASLDDTLPFESGQFDFLICALMLCHVPNLAHAFQEFSRVLQEGGYLLFTDLHPDIVSQGGRTDFRKPGTKYLIFNTLNTRADYVDALVMNGFTILDLIEIPFRDVPDGYFSPAFIDEQSDKSFCWIVLTQKQTHLC